MLKLMNYVLAGNLDSSLGPLAEDGWEISLTLQLFGGEVTATRALAGGKKLKIDADETARQVIGPWLVEGLISLEDWKDVLGLALFQLEPSEQSVARGLSVRTLLSYVIRTETPRDPLKILPQQSATSSRQHIAFMLGLDWLIVHRLANIRKGLDQLKSITAATREGLVMTLRPEEDLLLERATLNAEVEEWERRVAGFRMLEDPNELVQRADALTATISELRDHVLVDRRMLALYVDSLRDSDDAPQVTLQIEELFSAAGAILADGFRRQIEDVREFHASLMTNRRTFLRAEIDNLERRIEERSNDLRLLDDQRTNALRTLDAGGALDELNAMRTELSEAQARMSAIDVQIEQARELVTRKEELKLDRSTSRSEASRELTDSRQKLDEIGDRFSRKMRRLYAKDAALTVSVDDDGYKFTIRATGSGSTGVDRMTLFCFDLTMLEEGISTRHHPDFLVHDSSVFDGVDPRQRIGALRFAQQMVEATGGQYICTINSNDVPDEVLNEVWFKNGIVRTILDTEHGGLLGREF